MSYSNPVFQQLIASYPTWDSLQNFLTSPEGGHFRIVGSGKYMIIRYVKGTSNMKLHHSPWFRSVIWDTEAHRPVCIAPPKAESSSIETGEDHKYNIQEFVDGIMINVFVSKDNPSVLQIATRTSLGAEGTFYSSKSFHDLFMDALHTAHLNKKTLLGALPHAHKDDISVFASFVLQHPEHRVVSRARWPRVSLVHAGFVKQNGMVDIIEQINPSEKLYNIALPVYPMNTFSTEQDMMEFFNKECQEKGWYFQGLSFKDGLGKRWRLRNQNYATLRALRGTEALPIDRFLRLRKDDKVSEYCKHYAEERDIFWEFEQTLRMKTKEIYNAYCQVHKAHAIKLSDVPKDIQPLVFKLHAHYLESLKPNNQKVQVNETISFVNGLTTYDQRRLFAKDA